MTLTPTHPDPYAPKFGRKQPHDHKIDDLADRRPRVVPITQRDDIPPIPAFLSRQDRAHPRPLDAALVALDAEVGAYIDNANREKPVTDTYNNEQAAYAVEDDLPERMVAEIKALMARLPYGTMKGVGADIGKLAGIDGPKQADALHAWASGEVAS